MDDEKEYPKEHLIDYPKHTSELRDALAELFLAVAEELRIPEFVEWLSKKMSGL